MTVPAVDLVALTTKYAQEKDKRVRADGVNQYVQLADSDRWAKLARDPWVDHEALNASPDTLKDGDEIKVLILGAGYGGLLYAVRLIEAGFKPEDIRVIDAAGGFGGTWYWNRYPGLMCDVESYIYMPLLEETGYMPKHKYSYGYELREHADRIAQKWDVKASFRTSAESSTWDDEAKRWVTKLRQDRGPGGTADLTVRSQFIINANGVINHPKMPLGLEGFGGEAFHTARWDFNVTGGSPSDWTLNELRDKRVGIIGTGATAIQVVPELAKWAKELYVFQRTPCSVSARDQRPTDPEEWKSKIANKKGWQRERSRNFNQFCTAERQGENMVDDGWTKALAYHTLTGTPQEKPIGMEDIPNHIGKMVALDFEYTEGTRRRVEETVKDKNVAERLKAWYPVWCKRPTFHDHYLPTFNLPNVHLVDTDGKGVSGANEANLFVGDKEYPIDVLVLSTGYRPPLAGNGEPGSHSNMVFTGRDGRTLMDKWTAQGATTLHGVLTNGFPNMFITGPAQTGACPNFVWVQNVLSEHIAYIASKAVEQNGDKAVVEPTVEAEEGWSMQIMAFAGFIAPIGICTPSYINNEGGLPQDHAEALKTMRAASYSHGMNAYEDVLTNWRDNGKLEGLVIS
ncbi:hypothetical protein jhhlp_008857 [Lomentospora prolificans]|uniref:FAD/NAD(P)-binding domain-containing protein n=1 Tax=Lomentospora prolificans TaxID=41688 RepID=A0A2N3MZ82_9PEZI|nr:hypothetical protein jhhlp_008857 [Lomentospora prolificans]